jgi:hypothetical protein
VTLHPTPAEGRARQSGGRSCTAGWTNMEVKMHCQRWLGHAAPSLPSLAVDMDLGAPKTGMFGESLSHQLRSKST